MGEVAAEGEDPRFETVEIRIRHRQAFERMRR